MESFKRESRGQNRGRSGLCAPACAFFLFAARGRADIARLAELAKADRQPALALTDTDNMFGALEFSEKMAAPASSRSSAAPRDRFRRRAARSAQSRSCAQVAAPGAARRARGGLSQPDAADLARVPGNAAERASASEIRLARRRERRPDRADRRAGRRCSIRRSRPGSTISRPRAATS